ncbi:MAG: hypothetical protein U0935_07265 [Pirellulales bacterium]
MKRRTELWTAGLRWLALLIMGCDLLTGRPVGGQPPAPRTPQPAGQPATSPPATKPPATRPPATAPPATRPAAPGRPRTLADLLPPGAAAPAESQRRRVVHQPLEPQRAEAAGLRRLSGKHVTIFTDVPSSPAVDELPAVFDLALPSWCKYLQVDPQLVRDWKLVGYLMKDADRFRAVGALPDELPSFRNGFQMGDEFWWYEQETDYYRRHLMLHEGTHAFMNRWLGGLGAPWFAEGTAELLATHRWTDGQLTLHYLPQQRTEAPGWARIKIVKDEFSAGRGQPLEQIFAYALNAHLQNETYGWCWAAAQFLDAHPLTQAAFRERFAAVRDAGPEFTRPLLESLEEHWPALSEEWQLFVAQADYGYDVARAAIQHRPAAPLTTPEVRLKISAAAGWQSTGIQLEQGVSYEVAAVGRYQLVAGPPIWWCEPGGVTIRYFRGQPLGMLLGAVRPAVLSSDRLTPLANPEPIGRRRIMTPSGAGVLYLKINEFPGELADNSGDLLVRVRKAPE